MHELRQPPALPDYELFRCIGRGSYGGVWIARHVLGQFRAVKLVYHNIASEGVEEFHKAPEVPPRLGAQSRCPAPIGLDKKEMAGASDLELERAGVGSGP